MAIEFTDEQVEQLYNKGFTDEDLEYTIKGDRANGLSDDAIKANILKAIGGENQQSQTQETKGIDLTPAGIINNVSGAISDAVVTPLEMIKNKESDPKKAYSNVAKRRKEFEQQNRNALTNIRDLGVDLLGYSMLPTAKGGGVANFVKNAAIQGGLPMAAESLKRGGNPLSGLAGGSLLAAGIQGVPYVGKVLSKPAEYVSKKGLEAITSLKPETLKQVVKPNSVALDLTEDEAQNLLMNTTEAVRNNYKNLVQKKGETVGNLLKELPEDKAYKAEQLLNNYDSILNNYSLSGNAAINPARNATRKELAKIEDLLGSNMPEAAKSQAQITPKELYDINKNISNMVDWDKPGAALKNDVLEQIYTSNSKKLSDLSPELKKANKAYADLMDFQKNEGIRRILNNQNNIDSASSALRNYNSTVTKGNTNRNIQDLENILVNNGYEPFINKVDDVNAAMDLLKNIETGRNWMGMTSLAKSLLTPALKGVRSYNGSNLPAKLTNIKEAISPLAQRLLSPITARSVAPIQYGGISYTEEN